MFFAFRVLAPKRLVASSVQMAVIPVSYGRRTPSRSLVEFNHGQEETRASSAVANDCCPSDNFKWQRMFAIYDALQARTKANAADTARRSA